MGRLFGTDGIRGVAGQPPLDPDTIYRVGYCLTEHLKAEHPQPRILIGRDTRESGPWIETLLRLAIDRAGGTSEPCGVISTPAVSYVTAHAGAQAGIVISASHNPYQDNGIKIFSSLGMKFGDAVEDQLECRILGADFSAPATAAGPARLEALRPVPNSPLRRELYLSHLRDCLPEGFHPKGLKLVVDCGHGALSAIAPEFFRSLGADVTALHCEPDGRNINHNAGALHLEILQQAVRESKSGLGVAFDGDADRAMFVDSNGDVRNGDDVLYLFAGYFDFSGAPKTVVGTVMANLGLEVALRDIGFTLARTAVGDRCVLEEMLRSGAIVGGEQSGHVILLRHASTGDGLLTALKVIEAVTVQGEPLARLCSHLRRFPQVLLNVRVREKTPFEEIPGLADTEAACREKLGTQSRILLRYSGTEKLARVMVEGEDESTVLQTARELATFFQRI